MVTQNQLRQVTETRLITVDQVDMSTLLVTGLDNYGTRLQVSMHLAEGGVATVPNLGEVWQVERQNNEWFLDMRADTGEESTSLTSLQPGDKRIEAARNLYLNAGGQVVVNGRSATPGYLLIW